MAAEMTREMCLVVEANTRCHLRDGLPIEKPAPRGIDPSTDDIAMGGDPERARERPHEMRGRDMKDPPSLAQGQTVEAPLVEELTEIGCDPVFQTLGVRGPAAQMLPKLRADDRESGLRLQRLPRIPQYSMEGPYLPGDRGVPDVW